MPRGQNRLTTPPPMARTRGIAECAPSVWNEKSMTALKRWLHRICARHEAKLASRLQRDLAEYVVAEESRISIRLHRAAWHYARSNPDNDDSRSETWNSEDSTPRAHVKETSPGDAPDAVRESF